MNTLYYGDNLDVLRHYIADESVDLIYLDPPFNSKATYNVLFKEKSGQDSAAQIEAFDDTWHWDRSAAEAFDETLDHGGVPAQAMAAFEKLLGHNDLLAYLAMMAARLVELRRVLKPTGSIYLHCDPTASHYLKVLMDAVFGAKSYRNEVIWKRTSAHANVGQRYAVVQDRLLFYTKSDSWTWGAPYLPYSDAYIKSHYGQIEPETGRRYTTRDLTASMQRASSGQLYEWRGVRPPPSRCWAMAKERMEALEADGLLVYSDRGMPRMKLYLDDMPGTPCDDIWLDIPPINSQAAERLGYPTQKPLALLERIIQASSNEGDVVLDPFCGCGTAVVAAQTLGRQWIGIDVTHLAVNLMKRRLRDTFGEDLPFTVIGEPTTAEDAAELAQQDRHQFELWALDLAHVQPGQGGKKGSDRGIDGRKFFRDAAGKGSRAKQILVSVKSGHNNVAHVRDLVGVITREDAAIGVLICLETPTAPMRREAASAGFYEAPWGTKHPKIQILTIAELMNGRGIDYPRGAEDETFQRAARQAHKAAERQGRMDL